MARLATIAIALGAIWAQGSPDGAEAKLEAGRADEALALAVEALEHAPEDALWLDLASRASLALEEPDDAIWYATLALRHLPRDRAHRDRRAVLEKRVAAQLPAGLDADGPLEAYAETLLALAEGARRRKLFANAADLLLRCRGTRFEARADERLARLFSNRKAVEALLASGVDVPGKPLAYKDPDELAEADAEHSTWEDAWEFKGKNYTVRTNVGWELGQTALLAMEQLNGFYRTVFDHKVRGGNMARCRVNVYATREGFETHAGERDPGVAGFYVPGENRVETYDPRSQGGSLADLWSTLFHEASHQFTDAISADLVPGWLNEGTASYFEGAEITSSGSVRTNLVPDSRLANLRFALETREPTLRQVVSYHRPGSYDGSYYAVGWGLVYFLLNYEDERSRRIYVEPYRRFLDAYRTGGQHDTFERFGKVFVEDVGDPAVPDFAAFEIRFRDWIVELADLHFGPPDVADTWVERAARQRANGADEAAIASLRAALAKRRGHLEALLALARAYEDTQATDAAILSYRRILERLRTGTAYVRASEGRRVVDGMTTRALAEHARARVVALEVHLGEGLIAADERLAEDAEELATALAEAGFPRLAAHGLSEVLAILAGHEDLADLRTSILDEAAIDVRRWRRLPVGRALVGWQGSPGFEAKGGKVVADTRGFGVLLLRRELPADYRFEATLSPVGERAPMWYGLVLGANDRTGMRVLDLSEAGALALFDPETMPEPLNRFRSSGVAGKQRATIAIEVRGNVLEVFLDGRSGGFHLFDEGELAGQIGLFCQGRATFSDLRLRY